ncbi:uncharacterized protein LOC131889693 isoform X2 [Tigriopus californicus]|uniref:uncharacterized protein LOC131889693 isoform X2 n=1 Tax=Tigriopus californicus TaxID=6832 RepID=UPI0027DA0EED|nr:uncharacterized protein LOC131889693 isoform X2 [Tigriopus californicus]
MESPAIVGVPNVKGLRVRVGDIVSPAHLWISPSTYDLEQSRTILKPLLDAGPRLSNLFATDSDPTHYDTDDDIQAGLVAVRAQTKNNGEVYRGRVIRRYTRRNAILCDAFLIDIGETWTDLDVRTQIRVIRDSRLIQIEPMAESVYLYGLAPTSQDLDYSLPPSQSLVRTLASQWNEVALDLVTKIVRSATDLRLNLISQPRAESSDSLSGDIYFSIQAVSDRRAILASLQRNCPGILAHFFRSDDYYSLRQLLLTLNFCVDLGDSLPKTKKVGSRLPKLPASVPNTRVDPNSEMDAQDSNPIEYDVAPSQQDRSTLEDWITTKNLDVEEDIWDDMNEITPDDDPLFSQDQGEHEVAESSLVASKTSSRGRGDRRKRAALELSKTSNDSEERPGKQASIQKPQIQDLSQAWSQVRKELPRTSRSPAGPRMAGGVDVGKFIQGLKEKMNAKKNKPSQSDDEVSSFYDAQSQFEGESESERFSSCLDKFAIPERTEPDGCKSHDSSVASSKVIPTTPDFPQPTAPISPSQRLVAQDESASSELDLNHSQSSNASSKPSTGLSLLKSRFREKKLFKTSAGPSSPAISNHPPSVEISFDVPLDLDLETRLPDPLVTNPADVSYPWETIVHNPLNARRKSVSPCQNAADIRKWSREFVMCLDQARMATPTGIQKVMWPLVVDLKSVVAIGKKEVTTCGYLIPLIYSLSNNKKDYPAPAEGPSCVILCPSHSVVERVWKTLRWLTQDVLFVRDEILVNVVFENEHKLTALLANGCDVLITTPPSIFKCVEEIKSTNFMRCCHLVFEESDLIFEEFQMEVLAIM